MNKAIWVTALCVTTLLGTSIRAQEAVDSAVETAASGQSTQTTSAKSSKPEYRRLFLDFGVGRLSPGSDLKSGYKAVAGYEVVAGLRFNRYALAEFGADFGFGAGRTDRVISTTGGARDVGDYQVAGLFGGRFVLPLKKESFLLSAGGGYARLKYGESVKLLPNETINCISCTQRTGNGFYTVVQGLILVDEARHFGVGLTYRRIRGTTVGDFLQSRKTTDSWSSIAAAFSLRF
jgi:hypothetical protein